MNKKSLAVILSKIQVFVKPNVKLEQYATDANIAANCLWNAYMHGDIEGKVVADLGCGPGILGLGALILGAKKVYFVEVDEDVVKIAKKNKKFIEKETGKKFDAMFMNKNVKDFSKKVDTVVQNPPFGVKKSHSDKLFLFKAAEVCQIFYTFHKLSTRKFIESLSKELGFKHQLLFKSKFPLRRTFWFHAKKISYTEVGCWRMTK